MKRQSIVLSALFSAVLAIAGCGKHGGTADGGGTAGMDGGGGADRGGRADGGGTDGGADGLDGRADSGGWADGNDGADRAGATDDRSTAGLDGGVTTDDSSAAGGDDGGTADADGGGGTPSDPCDPAAIVALALTGAGTVTTTGTLAGVSSLTPQTLGCTAGRTGPEVVYSLDVPSGVFYLVASTVFPATTADTVLYLQTMCGAGQELACNDDAESPRTSRLSTSVTGPGTVYIVVDSFDASPVPPANAYSLTVTLTVPASEGAACIPVQPGALDPCAAGLVCPPSAGATTTCTTPTAPVIDAAELFPQLGQPATESTLFLSAHDGQGDWKTLSLVFENAGGAAIDTQILDLTDYWGETALVENPFVLSVPLGTASVDVTTTDSQSLTSASVTAALTPWSTLGQSCNAALSAPDPCLNDLVCVNATCAASGAAASACAQATAIVLGAPVTGTAAGLATDTFEGSCVVDRGGNDKVFRTTLPALTGGALAWDLVATTANASVPYSYYANLDSYLYVRSTCVDPTTELACADDLTDTDLRTQVVATNLAPGSYYVFLDTSSPLQNGTTVGYTLLVRARAVLPSGATCDPGRIQSRCQSGACSALTGICP